MKRQITCAVNHPFGNTAVSDLIDGRWQLEAKISRGNCQNYGYSCQGHTVNLKLKEINQVNAERKLLNVNFELRNSANQTLEKTSLSNITVAAAVFNPTNKIVCGQSYNFRAEIEWPKLELECSNESIHNTLSQLFVDGCYADFTFEVEGEAIKAHKCMLAARSPVFATMLAADMVEKETNVVKIEDITPETFRLFLEFLYSGRCQIDLPVAFHLLYCAEKYELNDLKEVCTEVLVNEMVNENVIEILKASEMNNAVALKESAMDYICVNKRAVLKLDDWKEFEKEDPNLACEVYYKMVKDL